MYRVQANSLLVGDQGFLVPLEVGKSNPLAMPETSIGAIEANGLFERRQGILVACEMSELHPYAVAGFGVIGIEAQPATAKGWSSDISHATRMP